MSDHYLTPVQVASRLGLATETVLRWIRRGNLPAVDVKTGRRKLPLYRVSSAELDRFIEARRVR